jgi:hypothetical protein
MKTLWGRGDIAPTHTRPWNWMGEWSASRPGRALAPGIAPPVPIVQEAGWATEPAWTQRLEEKSFRLCRGSNLDCPVVQPVYTILAELPGSVTGSTESKCGLLKRRTKTTELRMTSSFIMIHVNLPAALTISNPAFCIYVFSIILTVSIDYFLRHH